MMLVHLLAVPGDGNIVLLAKPTVVSRHIKLDLGLAFRCLLKGRSHAAQYLLLRHADKLGLSSMSSLRALKFTRGKNHAGNQQEEPCHARKFII